MSLGKRKKIKTQVFHAVGQAVDFALANSVYPNGNFVIVYRKDVRRKISKRFRIKIYGSITYRLHHVGNERTVDEYEKDIRICLIGAQQSAFFAIEQAMHHIQKIYPDFNLKWGLEVGFKAELYEEE